MLRALSTPFPGLRSFEPEESLLFFGREQHCAELLRRLQQQRFLAVIGSSGSGKSSLVKAGLWPALERGFLVGKTSRWRLARMRPGKAPFHALSSAVGESFLPGRSVDELSSAIATTTSGLVRLLLEASIPADESLLLVVDQFEELFRFADDADSARQDEAARFVQTLLSATEQSRVPLYVVITMRSDFLGRCSGFAGLPEGINRGHFLVPRMTREQRQSAVDGPLRLVGAAVSDALVQTVLNDVGDDPDQLPVLQHALLQTYRRWQLDGSAGEIDLKHYREAGGANALNTHADAILDSLGAAAPITQRIFRALTTTQEGRMVRRPQELPHLYSVTGASDQPTRAQVDQIVAEFARKEHSLLQLSPATSSSPAVIDIAHESLIRKWGKLTRWTKEEQTSAALVRDLETAVWRQRNGDSGFWEDPLLAHTLKRKEAEHWNAAWTAQYKQREEVGVGDLNQFLMDSTAHQDAERRRQKTLRNAVYVAVALFGLTLMGLYVREIAFQRELKSRADQVNQAEERTRNISNEMDRLRASIGDTSDPVERARLTREYDSLTQSLKQSQAENQSLIEKLRNSKSDGSLGQANEALLLRIDTLQGQVKNLTSERDQLKASVDRAPEKSSAPRDQSDLVPQITSLREQNEKLSVENRRLREQGTLPAQNVVVVPIRQPLTSRQQIAFRDAMNSYDRGLWADAAKRFEEIVQENGDATGVNVQIASGTPRPFVPYFYLGAAYSALGRCDDARRAWLISEQLGAVLKLPEIAVVRKGCAAR
jgi:hypothetical protein